MKYFTVEEECLVGNLQRIKVASDGEPVGDPHSVDWESWACQLILGYVVYELNEDGTAKRSKFYPVHTDTTRLKNDSKQVLEQIKADYPAPEWQNNEW